ncbi:MAG: SH3 domain-containing protein, partial [Mailhella sp.]|nr:SH3 domain-containing protein [Mailhella sp.]
MQKEARNLGLDVARTDQLPSKQWVGLFGRRFCVPLLAVSLAITSLLSGCGTGGSVPQYENTAGDAADLHVIPQSLSFFAERFTAGLNSEQGSLGADTLLRSHAEAVADMASFRKAFFQPWDMRAASAEAVQDALDTLARTPERRGFSENMHPWSDAAWQKLCARADIPGLEALLTAPSAPRAAITVRRTDLRAVPTLKPRFSEMHGAGQGWPFDLFQYSALPAGLPLAVHHRSTDGAWLFVETSGIWGWMPAGDAAFAGPEFCQLWCKSGLAAFVRDDVALRFKNFHHGRILMSGKAGAFLAEAGIGTVLPMV